MIRIIVAMLLAANLALYYWVQKQQSDESGSNPVVGGDLKLMSEMGVSATKSVVKPGGESQSPSVKPEFQTEVSSLPKSVPVESKPIEPKMAGQSPQQALPSENRQTVQLQTTKQEAVNTSPAEPTVIDKSPQIADKTQPSVPVVAKELPAKPNGVDSQDTPLTCYRYGPFPDRMTALGVMIDLKNRVSAPEISQRQQRRELGYWVLIKVAKDGEQAKQLQEQLKSAGISDTWRVTKGEHQHAISMGLFSKRPNADKRVELAKGKGFSADIVIKYRDEIHFWIDFSSKNRQLRPTDLGLTVDEEHSLENRECPKTVK